MDPAAANGTYDFAGFRLRSGGAGLFRLGPDGTWEPIGIGSRALELLTVLVRHHGEVVTRDRIASDVWPHAIVGENNISVHVATLRRMLDVAEVGEAPSCIQTVPGRGYRFIPVVTTHAEASDLDRKTAGYPDRREAKPPPFVLLDRPSIAVLPFTNLSGDEDSAYFVAGLVEEIITALSRIPSLLVIARNSSFAYQGKAPDIRQVGYELGVRYVLEGSVRTSTTRLRVASRLIDATTGGCIWADRFEGEMTDVFQLEDNLTISVVGAIELKIRMAEIRQALRKPTNDPRAYDLILRGRWTGRSLLQADMEEAIGLLRRATTIDPTCGLAFSLLAQTLWIAAAQHWAPEPDLAECIDLAQRARQWGQADPEALCFAAYVIALPGGDLPGGINLVDLSISQNPNSAEALAISGTLRAYDGDTEAAICHLEWANRLSPLDVSVAFREFGFALAHFVAGRYGCAADWAAKGLHDQPNSVPILRYLAAALGLLGRTAEARAAIGRLLAISPHLTLSRVRVHIEQEMKSPFRDPAVVETYYEGLRRAGLPE